MLTSLHDASIVVAVTLLSQVSIAFAIVYVRVSKRMENLLISGLCVLFSVVLVSARMMQSAPTVASAALWYCIQLSAAALAAVMVVDFTYHATRQFASPSKSFRPILYGIGITLGCAAWTPYVVRIPEAGGRVYDMDDHGHGPFFAGYVGLLLLVTSLACLLSLTSWYRGRSIKVNGGTSAETSVSFKANMGWLTVGLTAVLAGCILEYLWALGIGGYSVDHFNPRAIGVCVFAMVVARMLGRDVLRVLHERHELLHENQRLIDIAEARLNAARDAQHEVKRDLLVVRRHLQKAVGNLPKEGSEESLRRLLLGIRQFESAESTLDIMLDIARLEAGEPLAIGKQAPCDVGEVIRAVCAKLADLGDCFEPGRFIVDGNLRAERYYLYRPFLDRILINLLHNACKYSPAGSPVLVELAESTGCARPAAIRLGMTNPWWSAADCEIRFAPGPLQTNNEDSNSNFKSGCRKKSCAESSGFILISVTDYGIGIELNDLDAILDRPFYRTPAARSFQGTGIGLNLCCRYAEALGGRLWAESDGENRGSTFRLFLPRDPEIPDPLSSNTPLAAQAAIA